MQAIIRVHQLTKSYGDVRAVQGIDLEVRSGEIFAMLGPNGAGKSTTVEILEGLRPAMEVKSPYSESTPHVTPIS
jgi:ABC-2 type transport system ATP-binding protein